MALSRKRVAIESSFPPVNGELKEDANKGTQFSVNYNFFGQISVNFYFFGQFSVNY